MYCLDTSSLCGESDLLRPDHLLLQIRHIGCVPHQPRQKIKGKGLSRNLEGTIETQVNFSSTFTNPNWE
jgi:hypothetical protein